MRRTAVVLAAVATWLALTAPAAEAKRRRRVKPEPPPPAKVLTDLSSAQPEVAAQAATALGNSRAEAATTALVDLLAMGAPPAVAVAALGALGKQASPRSAIVIQMYAGHRDPAVRAAAITAAASLPDASWWRPLVLAALRDQESAVRAAAAGVARDRRVAEAVEPMLALLGRGDDAAGQALAALADVELARVLAEKVGSAPDPVLARCLGAVLARPDFGPDDARVQVVIALAKVPGPEAVEQLSTYVASAAKASESRRQAEAAIEQRLTGGN